MTVVCLVPGGFMEELDNRWILVDSKSHCPEGNSAPATLGLTNMAGKFVCLHSALDLSVQFFVDSTHRTALSPATLMFFENVHANEIR